MLVAFGRLLLNDGCKRDHFIFGQSELFSFGLALRSPESVAIVDKAADDFRWRARPIKLICVGNKGRSEIGTVETLVRQHTFHCGHEILGRTFKRCGELLGHVVDCSAIVPDGLHRSLAAVAQAAADVERLIAGFNEVSSMSFGRSALLIFPKRVDTVAHPLAKTCHE